MAISPGMISAGVQGLAGIAGGIIGSGKRKREQRAAQNEINMAKANMMKILQLIHRLQSFSNNKIKLL